MKRRGRQKVPEERFKDRLEALRAENRRLRREVARLAKENNRILGREEEIKELLHDVEAIQEVEREEESVFKCPNCKSKDVTIMEKLRGNIDYYVCNKCNDRGPTK